MSKRQDMNTEQTVHILTDRNGRIVGAIRSTPSPSQVQLRVEPLDGQRSIEVRLPREVRSLQTAEDFQRLVDGFHVPRGKTALVQRVNAAKPRRTTEAKGKRRSSASKRS